MLAVPSVDSPARPVAPTRSVPPASVPLTFLAFAGVGLVAFGIALAAEAPMAVVAPDAPRVVAAMHLGVLAFLSVAVLGAMHQFVPVVAGRRLRSASAAYATAAFFVPGVWIIASGFATSHPALASAGGACTFVGIGVGAWNLSSPLSAHGKGTPLLGLRLAVSFLVVTALFGVTYAFDRQSLWFALLPRRVLAHANLGLLGWLGVAYVAVAEKLWPMFLLAHRPRAHTGTWAVRLLSFGAAVLAVGLLVPSRPVAVIGGLSAVIGVGCHLCSLVDVVRRRHRRLELLHAFVLASAATLIVATAAGIFAGVMPLDGIWRLRLTSLEVVGLVGWLTLAVVGHSHKIVPFIAWTSLRARGITSNVEGRPLLFADLFDEKAAWATFFFACGGVAAVLAGVLTGNAVILRYGGAALAVAGVLAVVNLGYGPLRLAGRASRSLNPV